MHRAWSSIVEVPYCFSRSYVKFQGHTALKIVEFDPNWAFPDCNSSLNSPMAMKCCTKLETAKERCPIVFQGHASNFKVTRYKTSPILTQIGPFRTIGLWQLSNPSDLPCFILSHSLWVIHVFVKFSNLTTLLGSFLWKFDTPVWVKIHFADTRVGVKFDPSPLPISGQSAPPYRWYALLVSIHHYGNLCWAAFWL